MSKIYHTRESILSRLEKGPAQFAEWATSRNANHGSRVQARKIVDDLVLDGLIRFVHIGRFPYYILGTPEALRHAELMQIEESSKESPCGCILWTGFINKNTGPMIRPVAADAPKSVRRTVWQMNRGPLGANDIIRMSCRDDACICLDHMVKTRRNTHQKGRPKSYVTRVRITEAIRKRRKLTIEQANEIRISPEKNRVLAEKYGVSHSNISAIRRGRTLRDMTPSPFAGLMG